MVWPEQQQSSAYGRFIQCILISTLLLFGICGCQSGVSTPQPETQTPELPITESQIIVPQEPNAPKLTFGELVHDFGIVRPSSENKCRFIFENTGTAPLIIEKTIQSNCGCTVPTLTKTVYQPGEQGVIRVTFAASPSLGTVSKYLTVKSNSVDGPVILTMIAKISYQVTAEPQRFVLLPKLENANCPTLTLHSLDNVPFSIVRFSSTNDAIMVDFDPSLKQAEYTLNATVIPEALQKQQHGILVLTLDHPKCPEVVIDYSVKPEFELKPTRLTLFNFKPDIGTVRQVLLTNNYGEDITIESAASDKQMVELIGQEEVPTGKHQTSLLLKIRITPKLDKPDARQFRDFLHVNIKDGPSLELLCGGMRSRIPGKQVTPR